MPKNCIIFVKEVGVEKYFFHLPTLLQRGRVETHTHRGDFEVDEASICTDTQSFSFTSLVCDLSYPSVSHSPSFHLLPPPLTNAMSNAFKHSLYFSL